MKRLAEIIVNNKRAAALLGGLLLVFMLIMQFALGTNAPRIGNSSPVANEYDTNLNLAQGDLSPISYSSWGSVLDLAFKLILILGLIYLTIKLWRRFLNRGRRLGGRENFINILETSHLAQNQSLHLVEVGHKILLLGSTNNQVTFISEVSDEIDLASMRDNCQSGINPSAKFADYVKAAGDRLVGWRPGGKLESVVPKIMGKRIRSPNEVTLGKR